MEILNSPAAVCSAKVANELSLPLDVRSGKAALQRNESEDLPRYSFFIAFEEKALNDNDHFRSLIYSSHYSSSKTKK